MAQKVPGQKDTFAPVLPRVPGQISRCPCGFGAYANGPAYSTGELLNTPLMEVNGPGPDLKGPCQAGPSNTAVNLYLLIVTIGAISATILQIPQFTENSFHLFLPQGLQFPNNFTQIHSQSQLPK